MKHFLMITCLLMSSHLLASDLNSILVNPNNLSIEAYGSNVNFKVGKDTLRLDTCSYYDDAQELALVLNAIIAQAKAIKKTRPDTKLAINPFAVNSKDDCFDHSRLAAKLLKIQ